MMRATVISMSVMLAGCSGHDGPRPVWGDSVDEQAGPDDDVMSFDWPLVVRPAAGEDVEGVRVGVFETGHSGNDFTVRFEGFTPSGRLSVIAAGGHGSCPEPLPDVVPLVPLWEAPVQGGPVSVELPQMGETTLVLAWHDLDDDGVLTIRDGQLEPAVALQQELDGAMLHGVSYFARASDGALQGLASSGGDKVPMGLVDPDGWTVARPRWVP